MCAANQGRPCRVCEFCKWKETDGTIVSVKESAFAVPLIETKRLGAIRGKLDANSGGGTQGIGAPVARVLGSGRIANAAKRCKVDKTQTLSVGMRRLQRFLRLLDHLDRAPWANIVFGVNDRMIRRLTASHLHLITGKAHLGAERSEYYHLIDPQLCLDGSQNVVWITNRQQGKTSTLGKFIAALSLASPEGGSLCNVYSTSLDRAIELTKSAKAYVNWMQTTEGAHDEWRSIRFIKNNYNAYAIQTGGPNAPVNEVASKPKNPDSCRGDAPHAAFFDEIGFIEEKFWYKFALPLLQVTARVATCTTTPPPVDGFFSVFVDNIRKRNALGDNFFFLENHSLACAPCIEMMEADQCCHNLHFVPPWKSMMRFIQMRNLIPPKQLATFQTEVYGVLSVEVASYFPKKLVNAFQSRERHSRVFKSSKIPTIYVSVDPAGHAVSEMGVCASCICPDTGMVVILGLASVSVAQAEVAEIQALIAVFLGRLRRHPNVHKLSPIVPIVECNLNEVFAMSIVRVFTRFKPVWMPFTANRFKTHIVDGIGVTTTHDNKQAMVQQVFSHLMDGRFVISSSAVTCCRADLDSRLSLVPVSDMIQLLADQLKRVKDQDNGEISGKTQAGDQDDLAMALMLLVYWSLTVRATEAAA